MLHNIPVIPVSYEGESQGGYWGRLANLNGLRLANMNHVIGIAHVWSHDTFTANGNEELKDLLCKSRTKQSMCTKLGEALIPKAFLHEEAVRFCPNCYAQDPYHRSWWGLKAVRSCPTHNVYLRSHCDKCRSEMSFEQLAIGRCKCGREIISMQNHSAHASFSELGKLIEGIVNKSHSVGNELQNLPSNISLHALLRLIYSLMLIPAKNAETLAKDLEGESLERGIINAVIWLGHWPSQFDQGMRTVFGRGYRGGRLNAKDRQNWKLISQLEDDDVRFVKDRFIQFSAAAYDQRLYEPVPLLEDDGPMTYSIAHIADNLGIKGNKVYSLCLEGGLSLVSGPSVDGKRVNAVSRRSLDELFKKLRNIDCDSNTFEVIGFKKASNAVVASGAALSEFFKMVADGEAIVHRKTGSATAINEYIFHFSSIARCISKATSNDKQYANTQAAYALCLSSSTLVRLIENCVINGKITLAGPVVSGKEIVRFHQQYFIAARVAQACNVTTKTITDILENSGFQKVFNNENREQIFSRDALKSSGIMGALNKLRQHKAS